MHLFSSGLEISREAALFLVKLLIGATFDVFSASSGFLSIAPKSTKVLEPLWRRRDPLPGPDVRRHPETSSVLSGTEKRLLRRQSVQQLLRLGHQAQNSLSAGGPIFREVVTHTRVHTEHDSAYPRATLARGAAPNPLPRLALSPHSIVI